MSAFAVRRWQGAPLASWTCQIGEERDRTPSNLRRRRASYDVFDSKTYKNVEALHTHRRRSRRGRSHPTPCMSKPCSSWLDLKRISITRLPLLDVVDHHHHVDRSRTVWSDRLLPVCRRPHRRLRPDWPRCSARRRRCSAHSSPACSASSARHGVCDTLGARAHGEITVQPGLDVGARVPVRDLGPGTPRAFPIGPRLGRRTSGAPDTPPAGTCLITAMRRFGADSGRTAVPPSS